MKPSLIKIVIVEDDLYYNKALTKYISDTCSSEVYPDFDFEIKSYVNVQQCIANMDDDTDIMILDYVLMNEAADEVLYASDIMDVVKGYNPKCKFIVISGQQNPHIITELKSLGIYDYIDKNEYGRNKIGSVVRKIIDDRQLQR